MDHLHLTALPQGHRIRHPVGDAEFGAEVDDVGLRHPDGWPAGLVSAVVKQGDDGIQAIIAAFEADEHEGAIRFGIGQSPGQGRADCRREGYFAEHQRNAAGNAQVAHEHAAAPQLVVGFMGFAVLQGAALPDGVFFIVIAHDQ